MNLVGVSSVLCCEIKRMKTDCSLSEEDFENTVIPTFPGSFKNVGITFKNLLQPSWNYVDTCASDFLQKSRGALLEGRTPTEVYT
jgi:hypothetical protein